MNKIFKWKAKEVDLVRDYKKTFNTPEGKRVLYDIMKKCHILSPVFNPKNDFEVYINEGKRNVALMLLTILDTDVEDLLRRIEETSEQEKIYYGQN